MRRKLFTLVSAISLLLGLAVLGLWARSYWTVDMFVSVRNGQYRYLQAYRGELQYTSAAIETSFPDRPLRWSRSPVVPQTPPQNWAPFRFSWFSTPIELDIEIPLWSVAIVASFAPAIWLMMTRNRLGKIRLGLCRECGYDLRASTDRCPECGSTMIPAATR